MAIGETARLVAELGLKDNFSKGIGSATASLGRFQGGLGQMGRGVGQVAGGLSRLATISAAAAAGGLTAVVTTAASFEQAFTGVEKTVDGTEAQLADLEQTLRGMARSMPVSFEELAGIAEAGGALGIARESLDEFVDVVARLAVSTDLTSESAATSLGQLANVLHLGESDLEDFADSLVALGNAGASTESQIVEIAARFGAAGNSAGLSKEEILALSSAVASMGIEVEAGGSSLSRVFGNITTAIATSGSEVEAFTDLMGINAAEFRRRWDEDALGTFQEFLAELGKLDQFGQSKVLEEAGITGVRDINAVRLMAQNAGFLAEQLTIAEDAQGALRTESDKFFDTAVGQWQTFKNIVRDGAATIGEEVLPITKEVLDDLTSALNTPETRDALKSFGKDLAGGIRGIVDALKGTDFSGLIGGLKIAASVAKGAFDAFRALPEPIQQLAIAALVTNKVSGGAVGQIAKGLGNILAGALRTGIGGAVGGKIGGLLGGRGSSPAFPMWVAMVGGAPGVGGAPVAAAGGAASGAGLGSAIGIGLRAALGGAFAAFLGVEIGRAIGQPIYDAAVQPAKDFYGKQLESGASPSALIHNIEALTSKIDELESRPPNVRQTFGPVIDQLKEDRAALEARLVDQGYTAEGIRTAVENAVSRQSDTINEFRQGRLAQAKQATAIQARVDKQREAIGTGFREAINAEKVASDRVSQRVQAARDAIASGTAVMRGVQSGVERSIGEFRQGRLDQGRQTAAVAARVAEQRAATDRGFSASNAQLGIIARKNFSPSVNVTANFRADISLSRIEQRRLSAQIAIGRSGPLETFN